MACTAKQIADAIDMEAASWAAFFDIKDDAEGSVADHMERRRMVMRANVAQDFFLPLQEFLPD